MANFCKIDNFTSEKFGAIKPILRFYADKRKKRFQEHLENIGTHEKILRAEGRLFQSQLTLMQKSIVCFKANCERYAKPKTKRKKWGFAESLRANPILLCFRLARD